MNTFHRTLTLVACFLLLIIGHGAQAARQLDSPPHELVFQPYDGGPIYSLNPDTLEKTVIVENTVRYDRNPAVLMAPDGEWIIFYRRETIWRVNRDGSIVEPVLPDSPSQHMIGLSDDGRYFLFYGYEPAGKGVHVYALPTGGGPPSDLTPEIDDISSIHRQHGRGGLLVWAGDHVYCVDMQGSTTRLNATFGIARDYTAVSPDGQWEALQVGIGGGDDTAIMRTDCTTYRLLLDSSQFSSSRITRWTPDSRWLLLEASTVDSPDRTDIYRIRPDGSGLQNLTNTPQSSEEVTSLSPDGAWVYYTVGHSAGRLDSLHRVRPDGSEAQAVLPPSRELWIRGWSADNEWLMFTRRDSHGEALYRIRADGSDLQLLAGPFDEFRWLTRSPSRDWLILRTGLRDQSLYRMRPDGRDLQHLVTETDINIGDVRWTRDEDWVIYRTGWGDWGGPIQYYQMRPDGSGRRLLSEDHFVGFLPPRPSLDAGVGVGQHTTFASALILLAIIKRPPRLKRRNRL